MKNSMRYRQQTVGALLGVALLGAGAWLFFGTSIGRQSGDANLNTAGLWQLADTEGEGGGVDGEGVTQASGGSLDAVYENRAYGFRFEYPSTMEIRELEESGGYVVLAEGGEGGASFQIFILPWDEGEGVLTPERIRQDLPDITIANPQVVILPGDRQALIFESKEGDMNTREIWLVHAGNLYQITAPLALDATIAGMMATWKFE